MIFFAVALSRRIYKTAEEVQRYTSVKHLRLLIHVIAEPGLLNLSIILAYLVVWFGTDVFAIDVIAVLVIFFILSVIID
jgi:hypothetical protein